MSPDDQVAEIRKRHTHSPQFPCRTCFLLDRLAEVIKERDEARAKGSVGLFEAMDADRQAAWAERDALREELERAEDFRAEVVLEAFTAPDADWNTILDSLRARLRDVREENERLREALRAISNGTNVTLSLLRCPTCGGSREDPGGDYDDGMGGWVPCTDTFHDREDG